MRKYADVQVFRESKGLAVTAGVEGGLGYFTITHVASGTKVCGYFDQQSSAEAAMREILKLTDWTQPARAILGKRSEVGKRRAVAICKQVREIWKRYS